MTPRMMASLSLRRHKFATTLSVIAIGLSVACGGLLLRLDRLSESRFAAMGGGANAIVGAKAGGIEILLNALNGEGEYPGFLPMNLFETVRARYGAIPILNFAKFEEHRVIGTDDSFPHVGMDGTWANNPGELVLGASVAGKVGEAIRVTPWIGDFTGMPIEMKIVGRLAQTHSQWDRTLFASVAQAQKVLADNPSALRGRSIWGPTVLNFFLLNLNPAGFNEVQTLINDRTVAQFVRVDQQKERLAELSGVGQSVGLLVTAFVILLGGLGVCAMLVTRFEGMSLQLAVLRALGYTRLELYRWLLWEGLMLSVLGVVFGALVDAILLPFLRAQLGSALPPPELVPSPLYVSAPIWFIAIAATLLSVLLPMLRMSRQDTHAQLKGL